MTLDIKLIKEISKVTSKSAIASFKHIGEDNKILADNKKIKKKFFENICNKA